METRANHLWVGAVTLALLVGLSVFIVWLARLDGDARQPFDIFFKQSVSGLAKGSGVSFSGVPAGQVTDISLWKKDPEFVKVRIEVNKDVPVLEGTVATIKGVGFTGVSEIQLDGAVRGAPPIDTPGPAGPPVIPTKPGALGELLNNAPLLLERLATLTERLTLLLSDKNQASISSILANTDRLTAELAKSGPEFRQSLVQVKKTLAEAEVLMANYAKLGGTVDAMLQEDGKPLMTDLRKTLAAARGSAEELEKTLADTRPIAKQIQTTTLPQTEALIRDLRQMSRSLGQITEKLDQQGAGALFDSAPLPDYEQ
jgi:phospholipid/cholesterol/gamma-HCH transport system substrate-binding protein